MTLSKRGLGRTWMTSALLVLAACEETVNSRDATLMLKITSAKEIAEVLASLVRLGAVSSAECRIRGKRNRIHSASQPRVWANDNNRNPERA